MISPTKSLDEQGFNNGFRTHNPNIRVVESELGSRKIEESPTPTPLIFLLSDYNYDLTALPNVLARCFQGFKHFPAEKNCESVPQNLSKL